MGPMATVAIYAGLSFAAGIASAWFGFLRFLLIGGFVLFIGFAGFSLLSIVGSESLGIPRATGPAEGLGAGAAMLALFVLPTLIGAFVVFLLGAGVGWLLREATKPDGATIERRAQEKTDKRIAKRFAAMEHYKRGSPAHAEDDPPQDRGAG